MAIRIKSFPIRYTAFNLNTVNRRVHDCFRMLAINRTHDINVLHTSYGMTVDFTYVLHKHTAYDFSQAYDLSSKFTTVFTYDISHMPYDSKYVCAYDYSHMPYSDSTCKK